MNESDYYPTGTYNNPDAPWNEVAKKPQKVEVTVSITLSKTVEIEVDDYTIEEVLDLYEICMVNLHNKQSLLEERRSSNG